MTESLHTATTVTPGGCFPAGGPVSRCIPSLSPELINDLRVPTIVGRIAAIRQQVLEMPAVVVADALGYHHVTTTCLASEAGGAWSRHVSGDRRRSPAGWVLRGTGDS
ncbi:hypothetical protein GCM10010383_71110 [Streptomyces lomondensis]|uniref:Uncharacterized protein n=1 Tax=Streptomyces lomondensis TaxID=68229 RepID=A0ABQ2XSX8_9ACTN|nr:hypothetical protein GCM10010383_71110 [Streptomyces lomondensis]